MLFLDIQDFTVNPVIPSTFVGLLGLIVGYVYYYQSQKNKNELKKIKELNEGDRPKYLEQKLNDFGTTIDSSDLSPEHKYDLLKRLMNNKLKKYSISAVTLVALALVVYLVWGKKTEETIPAQVPSISNTFSFNSSNTSFDKRMIEVLKTDSFVFNLNDPVFEIRIVSEPPGKPLLKNLSAEGADYYYDSTQVRIEINNKIYTSKIVIPKTGYSDHIPEAEQAYQDTFVNTINQNFETIYDEILYYLSL